MLCPAGAGGNLQRAVDQGYDRRRQEGIGLAHEPVGAMKKGERLSRRPIRSPSRSVTPAGGKGALGTWWSQGGFPDTEPGVNRPSKRGRDCDANQLRRGVRVPALEPRGDLGRRTKERPRSEPDSGNPTVRDRRGACGNVVIMGAGLRPIGKPMDSPPYPTITRAPHFYPDYIIAFWYLVLGMLKLKKDRQ